MKKYGCNVVSWINKERIYSFNKGEQVVNQMSPLCRYDKRLVDVQCKGCAKPYDFDYIRNQFGEEYLRLQFAGIPKEKPASASNPQSVSIQYEPYRIQADVFPKVPSMAA